MCRHTIENGGTMQALKLKIIKIGYRAALLLPKEALAKFGVKQGGSVFPPETVEGLRLTPYDPDSERQTGILQKLAKKRRNVLRKLAK